MFFSISRCQQKAGRVCSRPETFWGTEMPSISSSVMKGASQKGS